MRISDWSSDVCSSDLDAPGRFGSGQEERSERKMTDSTEQETKKALTLNRPGRLELKKTVDAGSVRQSFPHGRTKTVQVEVKRKRTFQIGTATCRDRVWHYV